MMGTLSESMERRRHELWEDMATVAADLMSAHGVDSQAADLIGSQLADHFSDRWGGQTMSFPKDYLRRLSKREVEVYRKFRGNNYAELAIEFGMTERGMRKLLTRLRLRMQANAKGMPQLFDVA